MPRPYSWLPRVTEIRKTVSNSVRSHFSRRELEVLFRISSSAAGRLLEMLATSPIGTAHLVSRDALEAFLEQVASAEAVPAVCDRIRAERANLTRVKARFLLPRDQLEVMIASLPDSVTIEPGQLTIRYATIEELVARLLQVSQSMQDDPVAFQARCEPPPMRLSAEAQDARYIAAEIERMRNAEMPPRRSGGL